MAVFRGFLSTLDWDGFKKLANADFQELGDGVKFRQGWLAEVGAPFRHGLLAYLQVLGKRLVLYTLVREKRLYAVVDALFLFHPSKICNIEKGYFYKIILRN